MTLIRDTRVLSSLTNTIFLGFPLISLKELGCEAEQVTKEDTLLDTQLCNPEMNNPQCMFDEGQCCFPLVYIE